MLKNYIVTTIRNLRKHPGHFAINVSSLSMGMAVFIFIFQFVGFESSYDNYHEGAPIYRIATKRYMHNELVGESAGAMPPLSPLIMENIPEVEKITRIYNDGNCIVSAEENGTVTTFDEDKAYYVDENIFEIFNYELIEGMSQHALVGTRKMVLSESSATKYFGSAANAVGKRLKVTGQIDVEYEVTGVFRDAPPNSHFKPEMFFSLITYLDVVHPDWPTRTNWIWNDYPTYLKTQADPQVLEKKINELAQTTWKEQYRTRDVNFEFLIQPIEKIHTTSHFNGELEKNTSQSALNVLIAISIITLIVAWINYVNLATARSMERAKEVGVRKSLGANRTNLIKQFFVEAMVTNFVSVMLSFCLLLLLRDGIQEWLGVSFPFVVDDIVLYGVLILIIGGVVSSLYPAWIISAYSSIKSLKKHIQPRSNGLSLRKGLVLLQFMVSPLLIAAAYLLYQQTQFMISRDLGITKDQVLVVKSPRVQVGNMVDKFDRFKQQVEQSSSVNKLSEFTLLPGETINWYSSFQLYGDSTIDQYMNVNLVEYDFEKVMGLEVLAGRPYSKEFADSSNFVINEAAAKLWGYSPNEIIGRTFWWRYSPTIHHFDKTVVGVVANYKQHAFSDEEVPVIYSLSRYTPASFAEHFYGVRFNMSDQMTSVAINDEVERIGSLWNQTFPDDPFTWWFLDDSFQQNFQTETQLLKVVNMFTIISIVIAGMGLFGLTSFMVLQRTKEIGIRKALGASVTSVIQLLSREYLYLIVVAYFLALPLMWFGATYWLEHYEIKVDLGLPLFMLPLIGSLVVGLFSVMFKSMSAARQKPVETLRSE